MKKPKNVNTLNTVFVVLLFAILAVNVYFLFSVPTPKAPEPVDLREITVTFLGSDCIDCINASVLVEALKQQAGYNVTSVTELSLADSLELAEKYNLSKLQAILIQGEIDNLTTLQLGSEQASVIFALNQDALVYANSPAPYYDVASKRVKGRVSILQILQTQCEECFNLSPAIDQMRQLGIKVVSTRDLDASSDEALALISKYNIDRLPTLIVSKDALEYPVFADAWATLGSEESDGKLVLRLVTPPYYNVSSKKTEGLVELTIITDDCEGCYNASELQPLFEQTFGMSFASVKTIEANSTRGKLLVKRHAIELVPTAVLSNDALIYPSVVDFWTKLLGTQEKDGSLVLRNVAVLKQAFQSDFSYKNLTSGELVSTAQAVEADIAPATVEE